MANEHLYLKMFNDPLMLKYGDVEETKTFGFSSSECWNLDRTMVALLYERLKHLQPELERFVDPEVVFNGEKVSLRELITEELTLCEQVLLDEYFMLEENTIKTIWYIWAAVSPYCWW